MKKIVVNMEDVVINEDILDISLKGNAIVSELIINNEEVQKDYIVWDYKPKGDGESQYGCGMAFFSLSSIFGRGKLNKTIAEIKRLLKKDGRLLIWDVQAPRIRNLGKINIRVMLGNGRRINLPFKVYFNPFRIDFIGMIKILELNKFEIISSKLSGNSYYIEALNTKEANDENYISGIKRKIHTFKPCYKIFKEFFKGI